MKVTCKVTSTIDFNALDSAATRALEKALAQGAALCAADARQLAAPLRKSGALEASIGSEAAGLKATVFARKWYAVIVEFGRKGYAAGDSRPGGRNSGGAIRWRKVARTVHATRAKPFLRPALYGARDRIEALIRAAVAGATNRDAAISVEAGAEAPLSHTVRAKGAGR